ncbi:MAG: hypothetical protein ACRC46_13625 [Thermoguttaceae bacterium]
MMARYYSLIVLVLLCGVCLVAGCTPAPEGTKLSGRVTLDGAPLNGGQISLVDIKTNEPVGGGIKGGSYSLHIKPGEKSVQITATRVTGKVPRDPRAPNGEMIESTEQYIPAAYNSKSTLRVTVGDKSLTQDFELKTDAK